jgi:predicted nucleotidyltransferase
MRVEMGIDFLFSFLYIWRQIVLISDLKCRPEGIMDRRLTPKQRERLQAFGVELVYLFGSYAEGKTSPMSDIDIGIVLSADRASSADLSGLYNELYDLFTDVFPEESVDIVFLQRAGLEISFDAISHGTLLFESSEGKRFEYEEKTLILYADFKPLLDEFNYAVLNRF